jgi:hypothetical protein
MRLYKRNNPFKCRGLTLAELVITMVISATLVIGLVFAYTFFIDSWQKAEARIQMNQSASFIINTLFDGYYDFIEKDDLLGSSPNAEVKTGGLRTAKGVKIERHGQHSCSGLGSGNKIEIYGWENPKTTEPMWKVIYYHNPKDSSFNYQLGNRKDVIIPSIHNFGGELGGKKQERLVYVESMCFKKIKTENQKENLISIEFALRNKFGERMEYQSAIYLRNY